MADQKPRAATIDSVQLARLFDITPRWVQKLTSDGVLQRARDEDGKELRGRYEIAANVRAYVQYLRRQLTQDDVGETQYIILRNQKMASESEMSKLRLRLFKNECHRARDVEFVMTNMLTHFKARVLAIPSRTARLLIGQKKFQVIYDLLMAEIELCLRELAAYDSGMFAAQNEAYLSSQGAEESSANGASEESDSEEHPERE